MSDPAEKPRRVRIVNDSMAGRNTRILDAETGENLSKLLRVRTATVVLDAQDVNRVTLECIGHEVDVEAALVGVDLEVPGRSDDNEMTSREILDLLLVELSKIDRLDLMALVRLLENDG